MSSVSRRTFLQAAAVGATAATALGAASFGETGPASAASGYLVGAGKGDMTGAIAGQGMMGYSDMEQVAKGLLQRTWARAYIIADAATGKRVLFITADIACVFVSHHQTLLAELAKRYGTTYTAQNVNINATHNHNSCGGTAWDYAYVLAARGHRHNSFRAEIDGLLDAVAAAHASLGPGTVELGHAELHDASANRSMPAFELNPAADRKHFPDAIDPQVTAIRLRRGGAVIGEITWFATHGTSLTDANFLISADNKGYAAYLAEQRDPNVVSAHAQTNAGDMSPNLWLRKMHPGGPTADHRANRIIIGRRQDQAAQAAFRAARPMTAGGVDSATRYVDMANVSIDGRYTPHGKAARTSPAMMGAAAAATSQEDNTRSQLGFLNEGVRNEFAMALGAGTAPTPDPWIVDNQAPKAILFPLGILPPRPWIEQTLPVQLIRIGDLVLAALPSESTIVAGLRIRRIVADALKVPLENVLLQGYSNGYSQYTVTPEEYVAQQYEGGETMFGRWTLCAYMQEFDAMARAMARGTRLAAGRRPADTSGLQPDLLGSQPADTPIPGRRFGQVISKVPAAAKPGTTLRVAFCGAYPSNRIRRGGSTTGYFAVEKLTARGWTVAYDDDHETTEMTWERPGGSPSASKVTVTWRVPRGAEGDYRVRYYGDVKSASGALRPISGATGRIKVG
ncbi:neutral/alkaline non-lysosomal ceramidase N-terminal domain-containing protein [Gordonia sp. PS3]|uniref:Neutral ceramidase n=1 Tax=Gordonia sihwensis NBRC 108236 TaxID=1223544 RepID=L7LLA5_9ACTN|nr:MULTISPECIES: neutral/alkaline non-lysosomal ceramidase N-terminal domain-containing protein [Gordonia]AUH69251.1 alkaline ceramidase [Gordonia sp. YC-JH1]KXT57775.1 neutral/alkaline nonlysosomal ceramidase [Gordonia sp. QH-12]MBY4569784.1 alkaline ceramidase [Gordonia sihwensis]GAC60833.1 putative ceramidase [Gordonia sihwensis NBRC 108236]